VGAAAADTLLLCAKYLECVSHMHSCNLSLAEFYQQQDKQQQQQQDKQQQQQQLQLLQLPAADITAAVLHTASLLLADIRTHVDNNTRPAAVAKLLELPKVLQQTAFIVATLFGSQLQLNLMYGLHHKERQPAQHSSSGSSSGSSGGRSGGSSNSGNSSGSSSGGSGPPTAAAARAEGVLLCRAQHRMCPQIPQVPVAQSWLQHFEASWGAVLPPHLLLHVAAAIEATEGVSAPQQQAYSGSAAQEGQPYKLLLPEHCLVQAPATTPRNSNSSSSSSSPGCIKNTVCMDVVRAASTVLGLGEDHDSACRRLLLSRGIEHAPLLLLASATAALWLEGEDAIPIALTCGFTASYLMDASWCEGREGKPCEICGALLRPLAWPTVGLLSLLLQQLMAEAAMVGQVASRISGSGGSNGSDGSSSGSGSGGSGSSSASSRGSSATHAALLRMIACRQRYLRLAGSALQLSLSRAMERASPVPLRPQQLQQVAWATQLLEAAVRCSARLHQLLSLHGPEAASTGGAADASGAAAFELAPMLSAALFVCNNAVAAVARDIRSDVGFEMQQVLQAVMSLHLTTLSTAQGQPGAALPAVLLECAKMQEAIVKHTIAAAAAGTAAAQSLSATVAAGWFVVGRCLLQVSEQLQLCLSQPDSYPMSAWLLTNEQAWNTHSATAEGRRKDMHTAFDQLGGAVSILDITVSEWWEFLMGQVATTQSSCNISEVRALQRYRLTLMTVCARLDSCCQSHGPLALFHYHPEVLDNLLDPSPAHQQQLLQGEGPAYEAFRALSAVCRTLKSVGEDLCAVLPNRYFCNNPGCRNAAGVSAGFALVRGAACVCGGCVGSEGAAGAAAAPQGAVAAR
jgi:uncharacterized membrane protein YgcG